VLAWWSVVVSGMVAQLVGIRGFRLFQIGATNFVVIFSTNCLIHVIKFIICCHPLMILKSHLGLEKQPLILDPITVLTATNLSYITPS